MKTLLWLSVASTLVVLSVSVTAEQKLKNCNEVRAAYSSKGFNVNDVPNKGVNGEFWKKKKKKPTLFYWTFLCEKTKKKVFTSQSTVTENSWFRTLGCGTILCFAWGSSCGPTEASS